MNIFKSIKKKVGDLVEGYKEKKDDMYKKMGDMSKLRKCQDLFTKAYATYDTSIMDDREKIYWGTHGVDADVNSRKNNPNGRRKANNVVNVAFELIESQIDSTIPQPSVRSKLKGHEQHAQMIENSIKNDLMESDIYRINDENERTTPIQGFSIFTVCWNPDFKHHLYRGEIQIENQHPKTLIPQPGVYNLQKMDYFFLMYSETREHIKKRYDIDMPDDGEEYPEINSVDGTTDNPDNQTGKITVITKWYRDDDGNIGKFTWANDTVLEDLPNFYARRLKRCKECDEVMMDEECECGSKKYKESLEDYEELDQDILRSDGSVIPALSPKLDDSGQPILDKNGMPVMEKTKIPYFSPTRYPIVIRKNVPLSFNFGGQSDIDVIRDQSDCIKKVVSTIEEKILRGGALIKAKTGHNFSMKNELYSVVRGEADELAMLDVLNLEASIQQDLQFSQQQYKAAQDTLGVTNSFQGKPDPTAKSGLAKQIQINQASGRMMSKAFNKRTAFKELFEIMFEFKLAFYDELRPYMQMNKDSMPEYGEFNKYDFLERDISGEWYYNTDFLFSSDAGDGMPKDKMWLMQQTQQFYSMGVMNKVQFWASMENLGYPGASDYKASAQEEMQMQQQMMQQQQQAAQQAQQVETMQKQQENQTKAQEQQFKQSMEVMKFMNDREQTMKGGG